MRAVEHVPRQAPFFGDTFGAFALMDELMALEQFGIQYFEAADAPAQADVEKHRRAGHAFHAAADYVIHVAGRHGLGGEMHCLLA